MSGLSPAVAILVAILGFNFLIFVHELGHFLIARWSGMRVNRFSIGFGPPLIRIHGRETAYELRLFMVGGWVDIESMSAKRDDPARLRPGAYHRRPLWQRAAVVAAGPAFNFAFAFFAFWWLFGSFTALQADFRRELTPLAKDVEGAAADAGMRPGDLIVAIDGEPVQFFDQVVLAVGAARDTPLRVTIARSPDGAPVPWGGPEVLPGVIDTAALAKVYPGLRMAYPYAPPEWPRLELVITPRASPQGFKIGFVPDLARFGATGWGAAAWIALGESVKATRLTLAGVGKLIRGEEGAQMASVVKITEVGADTARRGSEWFLSLLAILSINLGLLNLLPIPALDGGRLMFLGIEAVARRPVPARVERIIHGVGMVLILGLVAWVTIADIVSYF